MPEALYFRTYPSGKLCFIREREGEGSASEKTAKSCSPFSILGCFHSPSSRPSVFFCRGIVHYAQRIRDGTPLLRLLNKRTLLYLPVPCLPDTSCFRQLCNQARSASGFVGRGEYRMILPYTIPFGRRNSHGKLCLRSSYDLSIPD